MPTTSQPGGAFTVDRDEVTAKLGLIVGHAHKDTGLPALRGVFFDIGDDVVTMSGSDLTVTITTVLDGANTITPGRMLLPARVLHRYLTAASGPPVTFTVHPGDDRGPAEVQVTYGQSTLTLIPALSNLHIDDLPRSASIPVEDRQRLPIDVGVLAGVVGAVAADDSRPLLCGVYVAVDGVAATNSFQLYTAPGVPVDRELIIPAAGVRAVMAAAPPGAAAVMSWTADGRLVTIEWPEGPATQVTVHGIDGRYPNWQSIAGHGKDPRATLTFSDVPAAIQALEACASFNSNLVRLRICDDGIAASSSDLKSDGRVMFKLAGKIVVADAEHSECFNYNPLYLAELLAAAGTSEVTINANPGGMSPNHASWAEVDDRRLVIMPVRVA